MLRLFFAARREGSRGRTAEVLPASQVLLTLFWTFGIVVVVVSGIVVLSWVDRFFRWVFAGVTKEGVVGGGAFRKKGAMCTDVEGFPSANGEMRAAVCRYCSITQPKVCG